jgi:multicomponent Na+:H+ antiporter subunit D
MSDIVTSFRLVVPLGITLVAPVLIWLTGKDPNKREAVSFGAAILTLLSVLSLFPPVLSGKILVLNLFHLLPGIDVKLCADGLTLIFAFVASFLWILATSYNIGYMRSLKEHAQTRYYFCFAVAIFGAVGVAMSANIFTLYLFYEIITIFTYPLVAHHQDAEGYAGGRKYIVYLMGTSKLFLLPAMILTYVLAGTLDFHLGDMVQGIFPADADPVLVTITYVLYILGIAKAAIMPLHNWLPSAMVAPTPVSALLHAVAVVKAGVFSISRVILSGFGVELLNDLHLGIPLAYAAAFTIVVASIIALTKDDLKARLAYSTVSQLSYIIIGVAMLTPVAVQGGAHPYCQPRLFQDHPVFCGRCHLCFLQSQKHPAHVRDRAQNALDLWGLCRGLPEHDRHSPGVRVRDQMVSGQWRRADPSGHSAGLSFGQYPAQCRLFRACGVQGLFWQTGICRTPLCL